MLVLSRVLRRWSLLSALVLSVAVITSLIVATGVLLEQRADAGVRGEFAGLSGDDRALRLSLPLADDATAQDAAVRGAIEGDFARADAGIATDRIVEGRVNLTLSEAPIDADAATTAPRPIQVFSVPDVPERAELVAGEWSGAGGATMQADAAETLGIEVGEVIDLNGELFEVTGTWRVLDPLDPRWTDSLLVTEGAARERFAAVFVEEGEWSRLGEAQATWSIVPDVADLTLDDLSTLPRVWSRLSGSLREAVGDLEGLERRGEFVAAANVVEANVLGLAAVEPVVRVLIAVVGLATLGQLARLLALARVDEARLLWSRGSSTLTLTVRAAGEALVVGALGAALGVAAAAALLVAQGVSGPLLSWAPAAVTGAGVAALAAAVTGLASWGVVRRFDVDRGASSMRRARTAGLGLVVVVTAAAALSTWQLLLYGSPLIPDARGELSVDPVPVAAPALLLIAGVLIVAMGVPMIVRLLDRPRRNSSVVGALAVAHVARRPEVATASVAMSAITVSVIVFAAAYAGTWTLSFDRSAQSRAGSDIAAIVPAGISSHAVDAVSAVPGVIGVATLHEEELQIGGQQFSLVAAAPDALRDLAAPAALPGARDLAEALRVDLPGPVVPAGAERLELTALVAGFTIAPEITLQFSDGYGVMRAVALQVQSLDAAENPAESPAENPAESPAESGLIEYAAELPPSVRDAPGPLRVLAIDAEIDADANAVPFDATGVWELASLRSAGPSATTESDIAVYWNPTSLDLRLAPPQSSESGRGFVADSSARSVRLAPRVLSSDAVPVVVSQALAETVAAGVGDTISLRSVSGASPFNATIIDVVAAVPSAPDPRAVLIDLGFVRTLQFAATEPVPALRLLWIGVDEAAADVAATGEAARVLLPAGSRIDDAIELPLRTALGSAVLALWLTAWGSAVLALVVIASSVRAQRRDRRAEVAVLRALGVSASRQGAIAWNEVALTVFAGALGGLAAGVAVAQLAVVPFARAALPGDVAAAVTTLAFDGETGALALGVVALGLVVIALAAALRIARDARTAGSVERDR